MAKITDKIETPREPIRTHIKSIDAATDIKYRAAKPIVPGLCNRPGVNRRKSQSQCR
jgi:hypothetical protein